MPPPLSPLYTLADHLSPSDKSLHHNERTLVHERFCSTSQRLACERKNTTFTCCRAYASTTDKSQAYIYLDTQDFRVSKLPLSVAILSSARSWTLHLPSV